MNVQPSGAGRLNKSAAVNRLREPHPYAGGKEKKSLEEGRAQASAQPRPVARELPKDWDEAYLKRMRLNYSVEEFDKMIWGDFPLDPETKADMKRRAQKESDDLVKKIGERKSRELRDLVENPIDSTYVSPDMWKWRKIGRELDERDWHMLLAEQGCWPFYPFPVPKKASSSCDKTVLKEPSVLASCDDKTDLEEPVLDRIDSDDLSCRTEGKQISPGKHATVTERDSQG